MTLSERSIRIKELISGQVDMGTFGLVELELIEFDKELHELKKLRVADVSNNEVTLKAFVQEIVDEYEAGAVMDTYFYKKAQSLL